MLTEDQIAERLGPEPDWASIDEEIRDLRRGNRFSHEIHIRLEDQPVEDQLYSDIIVQFKWGQGSLKNQQRGLAQAFANEPVLQERFADFLQAPIETAEQQARAKDILCAIIGIPCQVPLPLSSVDYPESVFLHDVERRLGPEIFTAFDYSDWRTAKWNEGVTRDDVYSKIETLLGEQPDLLSRLQKI